MSPYVRKCDMWVQRRLKSAHISTQSDQSFPWFARRNFVYLVIKIRGLIWIFTGRICPKVRCLTVSLILWIPPPPPPPPHTHTPSPCYMRTAKSRSYQGLLFSLVYFAVSNDSVSEQRRSLNAQADLDLRCSKMRLEPFSLDRKWYDIKSYFRFKSKIYTRCWILNITECVLCAVKLFFFFHSTFLKVHRCIAFIRQIVYIRDINYTSCIRKKKSIYTTNTIRIRDKRL